MAKSTLGKVMGGKSSLPFRNSKGPLSALPFRRKKKFPLASAVGPVAGVAASYGVARGFRYAKDRLDNGKRIADQARDLSDKAQNAQEAMSERKTGVGKMFAAAKSLKGSEDNGHTSETKLRHIIQEYTIVGVPRDTAYNQWTQFKEFPNIMKAVQQAEQEEDDKLAWNAKIGPSRRNWKAEITEQVPDQRIAWKSSGGAETRGVVTFHKLDDNLTRIMVQMEYHPSGVIEQTGNLLRIQRRRVRRELRLFKHFIELRRDETGEWRGEISKDDESSGQPQSRSGNGKPGQSSKEGKAKQGSSTSKESQEGQKRQSEQKSST